MILKENDKWWFKWCFYPILIWLCTNISIRKSESESIYYIFCGIKNFEITYIKQKMLLLKIFFFEFITSLSLSSRSHFKILYKFYQVVHLVNQMQKILPFRIYLHSTNCSQENNFAQFWLFLWSHLKIFEFSSTSDIVFKISKTA